MNLLSESGLPGSFAIALPDADKAWKNMLKLLFPFAGTPPSFQSDDENHPTQLNLQTRLSLIVLQVLHFLAGPMQIVGDIVETCINIVRVNGGVFETIIKLLLWTGITVPRKNSRDYLSIVGNIDLRNQLMQHSLQTSKYQSHPHNGKDLITASKRFASLCIMAARFAYENEAFIDYTVTELWNMNFVRFYNCWNDYLSAYTTQAFILTDKPNDAELILVAFRGTETFNANDWSIDFDFSWYEIPALGRLHIGFLEALGLVNRKQVATLAQLTQNCAKIRTTQDEEVTVSGTSSAGDPTKPLAFDVIREEIKKLLKANPKANVCITGHSLGAALAAAFLTILAYIKDDYILNSLAAVYTFGQPRIGDYSVAAFMDKKLRQYKIDYYRVVYSNDVVARVPPSLYITFQFKHFGDCCFVNSLYKEQTLPQEPNKNYFSLLGFAAIHLTALFQLIQSQVLWLIHGTYFMETLLSVSLRIAGLAFPGIAAHSPVNYLNGMLLGPDFISPRVESIHAGTQLQFTTR